MLSNAVPSSTRETLVNLLAQCHDDPDLFNSAILGRSPYWRRQREMCDALVRYRRIAIETGNSLGKDYWVGGVVPWWLWTRPGSLAIVTGPSQTLLGSVTWKEIRKAIRGCKLPLGCRRISEGVKTSPQVVDLGDGWHALGYSTTNVERASGQHAGQLLVIIEEASGVDREIWEALDSLKYTKLVAVGNPLKCDGGFVDLCDQAEKDSAAGVPAHRATAHINIPSTESPHAHLDHSPVGLADRTWLDEQARTYGKDSLWYRAHILAIRPRISHDALIPLEHLDWASSVQVLGVVTPFRQGKPRRWISCDVGEGVGRAQTVIIVRDHFGILEVDASPFASEADAAAKIARLSERWQVAPERISYDGAGAAGKRIGNQLAQHGLSGARAYFGGAGGGKRFTNLRTACAVAMAHRFDPEYSENPAAREPQPPFHIPAGPWWPTMREELANLRYGLDGPKTRLEDKETFMERLGRSPDFADALAQSFREQAVNG